MDSNEVLSVVRQKGPILPVQIKRELGSDTITIGAVLSELSSSGKILISNTKIGGSPVYYTSEQKEKLQELKKHLNDKQQKAMDMLKEKKVIRDREQEPVIRASLRDIKDFAKPLRVEGKEGEEIYWKWYLASNEEAEKIIRGSMPKKKEQKKEKPKENQESQKTLPADAGRKKEEKRAEYHSGDELYDSVMKFFGKNDIEVIDEEVIRKRSDMEFIVKMPTPVGHQKYYCKARGKKKCNDGDLSSAYIQGQSRNLPVLFLYTGDITKKAEDMLEDEFKGMMARKLG